MEGKLLLQARFMLKCLHPYNNAGNKKPQSHFSLRFATLGSASALLMKQTPPEQKLAILQTYYPLPLADHDLLPGLLSPQRMRQEQRQLSCDRVF
jgi:hypothetical protein